MPPASVRICGHQNNVEALKMTIFIPDAKFEGLVADLEQIEPDAWTGDVENQFREVLVDAGICPASIANLPGTDDEG